MSADTTVPRRATQAERRAATRGRVIDAAMTALVEDGYAAVTTRAVAERAGVAQSTVMHHFGTREDLLTEAMSLVGVRIIEEIVDEITAGIDRTPSDRPELEDVLDLLWQGFQSPKGLAVSNLWVAAWTAPELVEVVQRLEQSVTAVIVDAAARLTPVEADDPGLRGYVEGALAMMRGLIVLLPFTSADDLAARWAAIRPLMVRAAPEASLPRD